MGISDNPAEMHPRTGRLLKENGETVNEADLLTGDGLPIKFASASALDAFGRQRMSNPVNLFLNKNVHTRNKVLWEEPIAGAIIVHGAVTSGPFQVAETITGGTSGQIGTVTAVAGDNLSVTYTINHNDFTIGETITGGTSGATATVTTVNTGSHVSHDRDRGAVILQVGASSGDEAIRASHRYIPYVPGKSQLITETFLFGTAVANLRRRSGYFDTFNGLYLEQNGTTDIAFVRRTKTSGSVVNNRTVQANWSEDTLDGSGDANNPSGITLDLSKSQFLIIDFVWQSDGIIRWGFMIGGKIILCHEETFANLTTVAFMSTASLPVRHEITNLAATAGTNTMEEICSSVVSEGGEKLTGQGFTASTHVTPRTISSASGEVPIFAVRLKSTFGSDSGPNRKTARFSNMSAMCTTNNAHFELRHVHGPTAITATWTGVSPDSAIEYSSDISAVTGNPSHPIEQGFIVSGQAGKGSGENQVLADELDQHRFITQNIDSDSSEMFAVYGASFTGNSDISTHLSWVEFE